jgi:hypothetical protein
VLHHHICEASADRRARETATKGKSDDEAGPYNQNDKCSLTIIIIIISSPATRIAGYIHHFLGIDAFF